MGEHNMNTTKRVPSQESPFGLLCYKVKKSPNISNHFTLQCCRFQSQSNNHIVGGVLLKNRTRQAYLIFHGQRFDVNLCACRTILENPPKNTSIDQTSISYKQTNKPTSLQNYGGPNIESAMLLSSNSWIGTV